MVVKIKKYIFAEGLCFEKYLLIFTIFSILGCFYEEVLNFVKVLFNSGEAIWSYRRGVIYGPISPVYGAGAVFFLFLFSKRKNANKFLTFILGALVGGAFEYSISLLQQIFIGTTSWNYSRQFLNINGRTTVPIMMFWGLCTVLFIHYLYPFLSSKIESIKPKIGRFLTTFLIVFLSLDMLVSWTALFRQNLRRENIKAFTPIGELYDKYYTDEFLGQYFSNMKVRKGK